MSNKTNHMPTLRVIKMLDSISISPNGLTLTEITEMNDMPKSSLFPIAHTLEEEGFLHFNSTTSRYSLGVKIFEIGNRFINHFNIFDFVKQQMNNIVTICNETCHFAVLSGGDVLYLHKVDSTESIRMHSSIGKRLPAYGTGLGKALLCCHSVEKLKKLYPEGLQPLTIHTITDIQQLSILLQEVLKNGIAFEKEESNLHVQCIAVPIMKDGRPLVALSIAFPTFRATEKHNHLIEALLKEAKGNIEQMLEISHTDFSEFF